MSESIEGEDELEIPTTAKSKAGERQGLPFGVVICSDWWT
jgi:hypothetical protein